MDLASEISIEDQIKALSEEFTGIQQKAIDDAVARGDYAPGSVNLPERSEADWAKLMDQDADKSANNRCGEPGYWNNPRKVVTLCTEKEERRIPRESLPGKLKGY